MGVANMEDRNSATSRKLWLFDSFQGLPSPGSQDGNIATESYFEGWLTGDVEKVERIFHKLHIPLDDVRIIPGWFEETLKTVPLTTISVLHIDADWYQSVKLVLEIFYDRVVSGGFIVFDDYGYWEGCNRAVEDFVSEKGIRGITISRIGPVGAYFQKP
jgi:O-methyltransferase